MPGKREEVKIVTRNKHKFLEANYVLSQFGISSTQVSIEVPEVQSEDLKIIAREKLLQALKRIPPPIVIEDAGLFINALKGFPGPFSSYVFKTIGCNGILKLMNGVMDRSANFVSMIAYARSYNEIYFFKGELLGEIALKASGTGGFGFDPIFKPNETPTKTLAELTFEQKNEISHRAKSYKKLAKFILRFK